MSVTTEAGARTSAATRATRLLAANALAAAAYFLIAIPSHMFFVRTGFGAPPLLPGAGVALAAALIGGRAVWPGIFVGAFALYGSVLPDAATAVGFALSSTVGAAIGALAMRMPIRGRGPALSFREVLSLFVFGAALHGAIAAAGFTVTEALLGPVLSDRAWPLALVTWFVDHLAGVFLVTPLLLLAWFDRRPPSSDRWQSMAAIVGVVLGFTAIRLFTPSGANINAGLPLLIVFACTWFSMLFAQREAAVLFAVSIYLVVVGAALTPSPNMATPILGSIGITFGMLNALLVSSLAEERRIALMLAGVDALSGIANRRTFIDRAAQEAERAKRYGRPLALVAFDIDTFKVINDTLGHPAGDASIRAAAAAVAAQLRRLDTLARVGGDEFAVLMPETEPHAAEAVCERLRRAVAAARIDGPRGLFSVTASFGMTEFDARHDTIESALARADKALSRAKEEGRNRVVAV